tara:strand:- start:741 stop:1562 length:822 start_codon:yes stop_codon:yes gene_type:complete
VNFVFQKTFKSFANLFFCNRFFAANLFSTPECRDARAMTCDDNLITDIEDHNHKFTSSGISYIRDLDHVDEAIASPPAIAPPSAIVSRPSDGLRDILFNILKEIKDDETIIISKHKGQGSTIKKTSIKEVLKVGMTSNMEVAAKRLGVGRTWLKKFLRQYDFPFWPYRKFRCLHMLRNRYIKYIVEVESGVFVNSGNLKLEMKADAELALQQIHRFENHVNKWIYGDREMQKKDCKQIADMLETILIARRALIDDENRLRILSAKARSRRRHC